MLNEERQQAQAEARSYQNLSEAERDCIWGTITLYADQFYAASQ